MKTSHIVALLVIAASLGIIISSLSDSSTYADFRTAFGEEGQEFHVIGKLDRSRDVVYEPLQNANKTTFFLTDTNNITKEVILFKAKPQDLESSEKLVLIGKAVENRFEAREVLMKCPSKYDEENTVASN